MTCPRYQKRSAASDGIPKGTIADARPAKRGIRKRDGGACVASGKRAACHRYGALWSCSRFLALSGGGILLVVVIVTTFNAGAFLLDRALRPFNGSVAGLPGYEDFVRLAVSAAVPLFFPYCQIQQGHFSVDLIAGRAVRHLRFLWHSLSLALAAGLVYWLMIGAADKYQTGQLTGVLQWPEWPFYLPASLGMIIWCAVLLAQIRARC